MKYVFIINPASGKTDYDKIKQNIMKTLENENYEIYETKAPKEATEIASRFKNEENTKSCAKIFFERLPICLDLCFEFDRWAKNKV